MNPQVEPQPQIFYHAGLGKVASTYLQKRVFPALQGICYIPRNRFRRHRKVIARGDCERYLISRECGKYLDRRLQEVAASYPGAHVLMFFRRHDEWIASHYRRYVKNGGRRELRGYLDIDGDTGIWKREQLVYMDMIDRVENYFGRKPFVLTYDRLRLDPYDFSQRLAEHLGASIDRRLLGSSPVHASYRPQRLKKVRLINRLLELRDPEADSRPMTAHRLRRRLLLYRSYLLLLAASLVPDETVANEELSDPGTLEAIRAYYTDDWNALVRYESEQFGGR